MDLGCIAAQTDGLRLQYREVDGHDEAALDAALTELTRQSGRPATRRVVAHTVKGKGVSFMEDDNRWHYTRLNPTKLSRRRWSNELTEESPCEMLSPPHWSMPPRQDPRVLLLTGDHGYALFDEFRQVCPDQYLNAGVAEQNMVGVAAGLAKGGFRPIVYGLSAFVPVRVLEQIKMDVCYESLPVVFIGDGAGVVYSSLGTSHQSTEDVAALRGLPNLSILSPADDLEMRPPWQWHCRRRPGLSPHGQIRPGRRP